MDHAASTVMPLLRRGIDAGLWTLEDLDVPSAGWKDNLTCKATDYPGGPRRVVPYAGIQHRNLLRDEPQAPERPQAGPNPRDFTPVDQDPF